MKPKCFTDERARPVIERLCAREGISITLLEELAMLAQEHMGSGRVAGIDDDIEERLSRFLNEPPRI